MAKKSSSNKNKTLSFVAFLVLLINGVCKLLAAFKIQSGILGLIADICLVSVVVWTAYYYAKTLSKPWRIVYWILAILSVVSLVLYGYNALG